jgi:hypothetical protein
MICCPVISEQLKSVTNVRVSQDDVLALRDSVTKSRWITDIDDVPTPKSNSDTSMSAYEDSHTAEQNSVNPQISNRNKMSVITTSRCILSTECPTIRGTNIDGNALAPRRTPNPPGVIVPSLIMYKPNMDNELRAK